MFELSGDEGLTKVIQAFDTAAGNNRTIEHGCTEEGTVYKNKQYLF